MTDRERIEIEKKELRTMQDAKKAMRIAMASCDKKAIDKANKTWLAAWERHHDCQEEYLASQPAPDVQTQALIASGPRIVGVRAALKQN